MSDIEMVGLPPLEAETLSQQALHQSVLVRCHRCWCLLLLDDAHKHDEWHQRLSESVAVADFGIGGVDI